jgi:hypothetical protein
MLLFHCAGSSPFCNPYCMFTLLFLSKQTMRAMKIVSFYFFLFVCSFVWFWRDILKCARASSFTMFLGHTQQRTTVGRTPLHEWSARLRDLYLTSHNNHNTNIHAPGGIRTHDLSWRAAADLRLRPRGHWTGFCLYVVQLNVYLASNVLGDECKSSCLVLQLQSADVSRTGDKQLWMNVDDQWVW